MQSVALAFVATGREIEGRQLASRCHFVRQSDFTIYGVLNSSFLGMKEFGPGILISLVVSLCALKRFNAQKRKRFTRLLNISLSPHRTVDTV